MNSKIFALTAAALVGLSASADVLYWQVNTEEAAANSKNTPVQAYLMAKAENNPSSPFYVSENLDASGNNIGEGVAVSSFSDGSTMVGGVMDLSKILSWANDTSASAAGISSLSALSFFVELYDGAGNWVGTTDAKSYDSLVASGAISSGLNPNFTGVNSALGGAGSTYSNVPEPTSGLLMLVGLGARALRRRKVA